MMYRVVVRIPGVASVVQSYLAVPQKGDTVVVQSKHTNGSGVVGERELHPVVDGSIPAVIVQLDNWTEEAT